MFEFQQKNCTRAPSRQLKFSGNQFFYLGPQNYRNRGPVAPPIKSNNQQRHVDPSRADQRRDNFHIIVLGGRRAMPRAYPGATGVLGADMQSHKHVTTITNLHSQMIKRTAPLTRYAQIMGPSMKLSPRR